MKEIILKLRELNNKVLENYSNCSKIPPSFYNQISMNLDGLLNKLESMANDTKSDSEVRKDINSDAKNYVTLSVSEGENLGRAFLYGYYYYEGPYTRKKVDVETNEDLGVEILDFFAIKHRSVQAATTLARNKLKYNSYSAIKYFDIAAQEGHRDSIEWLSTYYYCAEDLSLYNYYLRMMKKIDVSFAQLIEDEIAEFGKPLRCVDG